MKDLSNSKQQACYKRDYPRSLGDKVVFGDTEYKINGIIFDVEKGRLTRHGDQARLIFLRILHTLVLRVSECAWLSIFYNNRGEDEWTNANRLRASNVNVYK